MTLIFCLCRSYLPILNPKNKDRQHVFRSPSTTVFTTPGIPPLHIPVDGVKNECALATPRVRTRDPVSAHSQPCECALIFARAGGHVFRPVRMAQKMARIVGRCVISSESRRTDIIYIIRCSERPAVPSRHDGRHRLEPNSKMGVMAWENEC